MIDPVAFTVLGFPVHWYGLTYLAGFAGILAWMKNVPIRIGDGARHLTPDERDSLLAAAVLGVILGGRLGFALFYAPGKFAADPVELLRVWHGGMSFHGGLLGASLALLWFAQTRRIPFLALADFFAAPAAFALALGRLANFVNGELWGRMTDVSWAIPFPRSGDELPRHPAQLYAATKDVVLGAGLLVLRGMKAIAGRIGGLTAAFLVGYGVLRFALEFFREPEIWVGALTMGQVLCLVMIAVGVWLGVRVVRAGA